MMTYFGYEVNINLDLDMKDLAFLRKNSDTRDKVSNLLACVMHAKFLGLNSVDSASGPIGHYIEMTWTWYGNRILRC